MKKGGCKKQITTAQLPQPEENLVIDNCEISQLVLVAQIQEINIQTSHTTLKVNDGTATIEVKQWHNDGEEMPATSNLVLSNQKIE